LIKLPLVGEQFSTRKTTDRNDHFLYIILDELFICIYTYDYFDSIFSIYSKD